VDTAQVSGSIYVPKIGYGTSLTINRIKEKYPSLTITYDEVEPAVTHQLIMRTLSGAYENDRVETVGQEVFTGCTNLTELSLPNVTIVDGSLAIWSVQSLYVPKLTKVGPVNCIARVLDFPMLKQIDGASYQMSGCRKTEIFYFGKSLSGYLHGTFFNCESVKAIVFRSEEPFSILDTTFANQSTVFFYVPRASVDAYKTATNWSAVADRIRAIEDYTVDGTVTGYLDESKI
jgi:hypothetical protein